MRPFIRDDGLRFSLGQGLENFSHTVHGRIGISRGADIKRVLKMGADLDGS